LLAKDPSDRPQTAREVAELLEAYLAHVQDPASPLPEPDSVSSSSGKRACWISAAVVAICLLVFGLLRGLKSEPEEPSAFFYEPPANRPDSDLVDPGWRAIDRELLGIHRDLEALEHGIP
jgi:hypothetical protein